MKHKLVLGLILSSVLSANSFAIEIHGGKLLSHKESTKGNVIKSSFKEISKAEALKIPFNHLQKNDGENWVLANSGVYSISENTIPVNTDVNLSGYSYVNIFNSDSASKTYTITSSLFVMGPCDGQLCPLTESTSQDVVTLDPKGNMSVNRNPFMTTSFSKTGSVSYWVNQDIEANDTATHFSSLGNWGIIKVTDSKK